MIDHRYFIYDLQTGLFTGRSIMCGDSDDAFVSANTPEGCGAKEGVTDWRSQRVDLETGQLVDYQPPPPEPAEDYEWIHDDENGRRVRRWVMKPEAATRRDQIAAAHARIAELEARQERAVREHLLGIELTDEDRAAGAMTLQEIEDAIAEQREIIQGATQP